ncbi:phosphoribosyltransferase [Dictyobacter formicarum]|uniref:Phosphoribosyl transferase n=1 Tax=Dictyobacter formicarum TaxID=2778368 RepID=A0ABQ3VR12_9CHLR|nr:phosphoribosyltransferase [Dictyobacter formicarum]GHO88385.1 phosphoribosyl transferase [Dictyobacter formicarum]
MMKQFRDRTEAGQQLAAQLTAYRDRPDVLVLALPRGGVPVAFEVACQLHAPLDVMIVRKLGVPGQEELAMGAIASGGVRILNKDVVGTLKIPEVVIDKVTAREQHELERREWLYRGNRPAYDVRGRTVVLVDDGIATGASMRAAVTVVKQLQAFHPIIAVPVAATTTCDELTAQGNEVICPLKKDMLYSVGSWYEHFEQTSDEEVRALLEQASHERPDACKNI